MGSMQSLRPMPLPMLITATTVTDTPIEVIMADTGNVKPRLNPLLPPPLNPKLMPPLMLTTDTTVTEDTMVDTVDTTDTPIEVMNPYTTTFFYIKTNQKTFF